MANFAFQGGLGQMLPKPRNSGIPALIIVIYFLVVQGQAQNGEQRTEDKKKHPQFVPCIFTYKTLLPMLEATSSVASLALIFRLSRMGLTSAISRDAMHPHSAIVSIIRWISR